ncbi:MAG: cell wall hydrolase [Lachnospiraceae bacterium]|nr:cell wall hydrolase [Lachnospiraceae bacterium]
MSISFYWKKIFKGLVLAAFAAIAGAFFIVPSGALKAAETQESKDAETQESKAAETQESKAAETQESKDAETQESKDAEAQESIKFRVAEALLPDYISELIKSGVLTPDKEADFKFIEENAFSTVDVEAEYEEKYNKTKWNDSFGKADLKYLSCIIYCEANSMSNEGKVAVGNVVLNRMRNASDWGHVTTIKEVIYDRKWGVQFSPTANGSMKKALKLYKSMDPEVYHDWEIKYMEQSIEAAKQVLRGKKVVPDDFLYFNGYVTSSKKKCEAAGTCYKIIGPHIYFQGY